MLNNHIKINKPILACFSAIVSVLISCIIAFLDVKFGILNHSSYEELLLFSITCFFLYLVSIFKLNLLSENNTNLQFFLDSMLLIISLHVFYILVLVLDNFI